MKTKIMLISMLSLYGCAYAGESIKLSPTEKTQAQSIAVRRQAIKKKEQETNVEFQRLMSTYQADENKLNIESDQMVFEIRKNHSLDSKTSFRLDEWNGVLLKEDPKATK